MNSIKYDYSIDRSLENYTANKLLKHIPVASRVLDVGCSTGYLCRIMQTEFQCQVTGIELSAEAAQKAQPFCDKVLVGDVEHLDLGKALGAKTFDVIVFADILEHLKYPAKVLRQCRLLLKEDGFILVSVPNFGYKGVLHSLFSGKLEKRSHGIMDDTHRQFYTLDALLGLLGRGSFLLVDLDRTVKALEDSEFLADKLTVFPEICEAIEEGPEADTYQFIVKARPVDGIGIQESVDFLSRLVLNYDQLNRRWGRDRKYFQQMAVNKNQQIRKRDDVIAAKNRILEERNEVITKKNQMLAERDQVITNKNRMIRQREEVLTSKNKIIEELGKTIESQRLILAEHFRILKYSPVYRIKKFFNRNKNH